jgi:hypothetical protein
MRMWKVQASKNRLGINDGRQSNLKKKARKPAIPLTCFRCLGRAGTNGQIDMAGAH